MNSQLSERGVQPFINVTPLIDVLLVLLIIFMVVTPLKPSRFKAMLPEESREEKPRVESPPLTLVVTINPDRTLKLNQTDSMGSVDDMGKLSATLVELFQEREKNHSFAFDMQTRTDLTDAERTQKTVFIKAPRAIRYGEVVKVIDGIKSSGGNPIGLQLDDLN
jgi:biopolymer transport protein ExbD